MNIKNKIIITDTNIITDLSVANVLEIFVTMDNVYTSDLVKRDEINANTGDIETIKLLKTITASPEQLKEIFEISEKEKSLSAVDIINYILSRDNNAILATGDKKLLEFSKNNGIKVIRTLAIIKNMWGEQIITTKKAIDACNRLKKEKSTRIPEKDIDDFISTLEKDLD